MDFPPELTDDPYYHLAQTGPYAPVIGAALITMVEPHVGHERAYNRWYEDDHFYSGAMAMPWMFGGRRWVATRELQLMRYPDDSAIAQPVISGRYLDGFERVDGVWRFATRKMYVDLVGDLSQHLLFEL